MAVVNKFNVNGQVVDISNSDITANNVSYDDSFQYDENTVGDKLSELESQAIYDVSSHNNGATFASLSALLSDENLSTLIPTSVRHGGMSIRFVQSSDNKYVQYRLMSPTWSINSNFWSFCSENTLVNSSEYIDVKTDYENKILEATKKDGTKEFTSDVQINGKILCQNRDVISELENADNVINNPNNPLSHGYLSDMSNKNWLQVNIDNENKIIEGTKNDGLGTKVINVPVETPVSKTLYLDDSEWIEVKTDQEGKILEGLNKNGEKHISQFCDTTKGLIKKIVRSESNVIEIPQLDSNFKSPVPLTVTGNKGEDDAVYKFSLTLSNDAFNIRFKFRITENILNQNKRSIIAQIGNAYVALNPTPFTQITSTYTYNGETKTSYYGSFDGGIHLNDGRIISRKYDRNVGTLAFSVLYTGNDINATIENNGSAFVLKDGGNTTTFSFETYPTVDELYEALKTTQNISIDFNELNHRRCTELAIFPETKLGSYYYSGTHGKKDEQDEVIEYFDNAPVYIPYAVDERWHRVEIVKLGDYVYVICDGQKKVFNAVLQNYEELTLGGGCGVLFKDFEVHTDSVYDFELVDNNEISSYSPNYIIFEGHNMIDTPSIEVDATSSEMGVTVDRLSYVFDYMKAKGYIPVSIYDIVDYYDRNTNLPKRCFTIIMDDFQWKNCLNARFRRVFENYGVKPALAIISEYNNTITLNGNQITIDKAAQICRMHNFDLLSHTKNHRYNANVKPSEYISEFTTDLYSCDERSIDGNILVYPFGSIRTYMFDVLEWLGYRSGVYITGNTSLNKLFLSKYNLIRTEIGIRNSIENIINSIL